MISRDQISHQGIVTNLIGNKAIVSLIESAECHECRLKSFCGERHTDRFEVPRDRFEIGDPVVLEMAIKTGFRAVFYGYFLPFLLVFLATVLGSVLNIEEIWVGLSALLIIAIYLIGLIALKSYTKDHFHLKASKL
ncbi:MAG: SoxR reducing system RseC family protein [Cyclobacteriaceae bacterium]|nr:SoxR reducing system RseC family protein [Cyclobacteriaceae bacterium HetDA_MAG_MS6]